MKKGDVIRCTGKEQMVEIDQQLCIEGYTTDFLYQHNGEHGLFIEIIKVPREIKTNPKEKMCDDYCRFTSKDYLKEYGGITEENLEQICENCPLKEL